MIKGVIFDMDGVIIDSEPIHRKLIGIILKKLGITIDEEELEQYTGVTSRHLWGDLKGKYNIDYKVDELLDWNLELTLDNIKTESIEPIEGIRDLLAFLKDKKMALAVASSSPLEYIHAVLDKFKIKGFFDIIVSGSQVANSKPAPDIFLRAAELLNIDPNEAIVIEDSTHGVNAAKSADMTCIGFNNINSNNQDISKADRQVDSIIEALDYIRDTLNGKSNN